MRGVLAPRTQAEEIQIGLGWIGIEFVIFKLWKHQNPVPRKLFCWLELVETKIFIQSIWGPFWKVLDWNQFFIFLYDLILEYLRSLFGGSFLMPSLGVQMIQWQLVFQTGNWCKVHKRISPGCVKTENIRNPKERRKASGGFLHFL